MSRRVNVAPLIEANNQRSLQASGRDAEIARGDLGTLGGACPPAWRAVAEARIAYPGASWTRVAAAIGLTRDQAYHRFRRMRTAARRQLKPGDPIPPERTGGMTGFVVGECGHRVAGSEWAAGFRNCERCGSGAR